MQICVIVPAAGLGKRFGQGEMDAGSGRAASGSKLDQRLGAGSGAVGKPVFVHAVEAFAGRAEVGRILLAVRPDALSEFRFKWADRLALLDVEIIAGGEIERWQTVAQALEHVPGQTTHVAVHDAARPLVSAALIDRVFAAASTHRAVIPGTPLANTLKRVKRMEAVDPAAASNPPSTLQGSPEPNSPTGDWAPHQALADDILGLAGQGSPSGGVQPGLPPAPAEDRLSQVIQTLPRNDLVEVQTPQVFELGLMRQAYGQIAAGEVDPLTITDDAGLVEALGQPVHVVEGQRTNLKLTHPDDLELAQALITQRAAAQAKQTAATRLFADDDEQT